MVPAKSPAAQSSKPGAGAPAPAVKPAQIPGAKPVAATKPAAEASTTNKLERVNVVSHPDEVQIEISSQQAVTPKVTRLSSPERLLIELPATADATPKSKIAVGSAGVKGVRIGMDGKTPPTTSVVIDLEQAHEYDMTPGPATKLVLTLHGQDVAAKNVAVPAPAAKSAPAVAKSAPTVAKAVVAASTNKSVPMPKQQTATAKPTMGPGVIAPKVAVAQASVPVQSKAGAKPVIAAAPVAKTVIAAKTDVRPATPAAKIAAPEKPAAKIAELPKPEEKKWAMTGKRDPFFSPVVQDNSGSGCSTGKKCLEIGQINVRGVVKSDAGYIAVVTNSQDKAYFLHENDPVFNGYVLKITGDSVVFQETVQDKLGKPFLREVTKKLTTPAV
jgi:Tfp pilus assembly protein PilP